MLDDRRNFESVSWMGPSRMKHNVSPHLRSFVMYVCPALEMSRPARRRVSRPTCDYMFSKHRWECNGTIVFHTNLITVRFHSFDNIDLFFISRQPMKCEFHKRLIRTVSYQEPIVPPSASKYQKYCTYSPHPSCFDSGIYSSFFRKLLIPLPNTPWRSSFSGADEADE